MKPTLKPLVILTTFSLVLSLSTAAQPQPPRAGGPDGPLVEGGSRILAQRVAEDAGSTNAPLLFCIGMHIEPFGAMVSQLAGGDPQRAQPRPDLPGKQPPGRPGPGGKMLMPDYHTEFFFQSHLEDIRTVISLVEKHGGKFTVQAQTPFTELLAEGKEPLFAELEKRGHEVALHFHEDAHLGRNCGSLPVETWTKVMQEEIAWLKKAGATRIRYWSGGNLFPGVLDAAATAGLDVMSDHKNPRRQQTDERLLGVHPWRPAGGPAADDLDAFARHDPAGKIIYLPDGKFSRVDHAGMRRSEQTGGDWKYFDFLTEGLEMSLRATRADRVNVFHVTVHAGEFRERCGEPFAVIDAWLREVVAPLVQAGKVRWATFSEMADAYARWEKAGSTEAASRASAAKPPEAARQSSIQSAPPTFFAVHCEAHSASPAMWDALCRFVAMADRYRAKLTLMFNQQWADFICPEPERFARVKAWQKNGHELAVHYHNVAHGDWNGHSNRKDDRTTRDPKYRGTVAQMMASLQQLAAPDTMLTMCMGPDARWDSLIEIEIDEPDYPDGIRYDVDGMDVGLTRPMKTRFKDRELLHLKHHFFAPGERAGHLEKIKEEFQRAKPGEVLGLVTHEMDFARSPEFIEQWFRFCQENGAAIRTVRDIIQSHPADQIHKVQWVRQDADAAPKRASPPEGLRAKVWQFQDLLQAAKDKNLDTSTAETLDRQSREAAGSGDPSEAERLLDRAIEALGSKPRGLTEHRGNITFAVNCHDWRFVDESADTVLRLISIFEKHGVRGDFYLTAPLVERYVEKRPDVVQRLKESHMTLSYHVRAPHPLWRGFSEPLAGKEGAALAGVLRDYETFQLDLRTGGLDRARTGGYRYVEEVFGRKPVAVGSSDAAPEIKRASSRVYADMGARVAVFHHETGTKLEQPFEFRDGLLARPSDFSVTRFPVPDNPQGLFWWSMVGTPRAAEFDPVALLESRLEEWKGERTPFITALIHENDFYREGGPGWNSVYFAGQGAQARPRRAPFDLDTPPTSQARSAETREAIFRKYEELVGRAAATLRVVTSEDIAALAQTQQPAGMSSAVAAPRPIAAIPTNESQQSPAEMPLRPQPGVRGRGELPQIESDFIRIPSSAAGEEGVAASLLLPRQPRYTNGAPVVIHVAGGVQAGNARGRPEYVGHGFVEIHFAFPGGGVGEERSGGTYDFRGTNSVRALADVIRFANGRLADKEGRFIGEVGRGVMVLTNNVGIVGSSHGGNACGLAMAKHGREFPDLAWYASMESPYGEGAANVEFGGHESGVNPAYDPKTGVLDLSKLAWSSEPSPGLFRKPMLVETRAMQGAFFFDLNGDGHFSRNDDFPANCFVGDAGGGSKAWYSPRVLAEAQKRRLIPGERPAHVPTLAEAREFWSWRDAAPSIPEAVRRCTNLAVIVYANERDHVQADPAHTHILEQVEGFRKAGGRFVRLNPDRAYVERIAPTSPRLERRTTFADNPAGKIWTRTNIAEGLEPSVFAQGPYMQAAVCELADRTQAGDWSVNLGAVLYPEAPRPAFPPPRRRPPGVGPRPFNP